MDTLRHTAFQNETVVLDGKHFIDCTLKNCTLEYSGGPVILERTIFGNAIMSFLTRFRPPCFSSNCDSVRSRRSSPFTDPGIQRRSLTCKVYDNYREKTRQIIWESCDTDCEKQQTCTSALCGSPWRPWEARSSCGPTSRTDRSTSICTLPKTILITRPCPAERLAVLQVERHKRDRVGSALENFWSQRNEIR